MVIPKSSRSISVRAEKIARSPPQGSRAWPSKVTASGTLRVTPWMVRSPCTMPLVPDHSTAVLRNVACG